ncbi:hypothetical protein Dimus_009682 [Dionaea muscipula]
MAGTNLTKCPAKLPKSKKMNSDSSIWTSHCSLVNVQICSTPFLVFSYLCSSPNLLAVLIHWSLMVLNAGEGSHFPEVLAATANLRSHPPRVLLCCEGMGGGGGSKLPSLADEGAMRSVSSQTLSLTVADLGFVVVPLPPNTNDDLCRSEAMADDDSHG